MSTTRRNRALSRRLHFSLIAILLNPCIACLSGIDMMIWLAPTATSQTVTVDVSMSNQTLEGWGTSLAWFANTLGGWTNTSSQNNLTFQGPTTSTEI